MLITRCDTCLLSHYSFYKLESWSKVRLIKECQNDQIFLLKLDKIPIDVIAVFKYRTFNTSSPHVTSINNISLKGTSGTRKGDTQKPHLVPSLRVPDRISVGVIKSDVRWAHPLPIPPIHPSIHPYVTTTPVLGILYLFFVPVNVSYSQLVDWEWFNFFHAYTSAASIKVWNRNIHLKLRICTKQKLILPPSSKYCMHEHQQRKIS